MISSLRSLCFFSSRLQASSNKILMCFFIGSLPSHKFHEGYRSPSGMFPFASIMSTDNPC
ncbi:hypothetical protein CW304_24390 [Bacillus sp. UFRGS-B20]|nr:hypothetical protein CW304_24390 [Bacillus sp. UFRGS-B20]